VPQTNEIITALETDEQVKIVVFDSALDAGKISQLGAI